MRDLQANYFIAANTNSNISVEYRVIEFVLLRYSMPETCVFEVED